MVNSETKEVYAPQQKRAVQTRTRILRAARDLFSKKGFHGARVDAIATKARVNKQRIYAYFGSKEGLFGVVLREAFENVVREEESFRHLGEDDIPRLAELLLWHYHNYHKEHPHFWRLISWENLEGGKHTEVLRGIKDPTFQHISGLYETGQARGIYPAGVSFPTFMFVMSAVTYFYFANQRTMTQTLELDLASSEIRDRLMREMLLLFGMQAV